MSPKRAYHARVGLAVAVVASSLAWGAIASTASVAAPNATVQPGAAGIQPRSGASFDDTYAEVGTGIYVEDDTPTTRPNPATLAVDLDDDTVYVANAWTGTVEAISRGQINGNTAPRLQVGIPVSRPSPPFDPRVSKGLFGIAVDSGDDTVYVVNRGQGTSYLWAINGRTMTVDDTEILSGCNAADPNQYTPEYKTIAANSSLDKVYVPCNASGADAGKARLLAVDGRTLSVTNTYTSAGNFEFMGIAIDPTSSKVFVSGWNGTSGRVQAFNGSTLALSDDSVTPFAQPAALVIGDDSLYAASFTTSELWARSLSTSATSSISLGGSLGSQALAYQGGVNRYVFVGSEKCCGTDRGLRSVSIPEGTVRSVSGGAVGSMVMTSQGLIYTGNNWDSQYTNGFVRAFGRVPAVMAPPAGTPGDTQVSLTWAAATSTLPITNYKVVASPGGASCTVLATSCTITGLTGGTAYTFKAQAENAVGWSSLSTASAPVTPTALPGAPTGATATAGVQAATVSWTEPVNKGFPATLTSYRVTANPGGAQCTAAPPATSCTVSPLTAGTAYTFTVEAQNATGWSPSSAPSNSVTPSAPAPVANMQLTVSSSPARFEKAGDVLAITATVLNIGTDTLNSVTVKQGQIPLTCMPSTPVATLTPGNSIVCRGTHAVTEEEVDAAEVRDKVTASALAGLTGAPLSATAVLAVPGPPPPERLQLRVVMNSSPASFTRQGERLTLTALVNNSGNVSVRDLVITGSPVALTCTPSSPVRSLAVKDVMRCSGSYKVTKADMSAGVIRGLTRATGSSASGSRIASTGAVEVGRTSPERAVVKVSMSSTPDAFRRAGQTLTLKAIAINKGDVPLTNVTVTGTPGRFTCEPRTPTAILDVDATITCTAKYDVTAADVKAGVIRASARASGISAKGAATSDDVVIRLKEASPPRGRSVSSLVPRLVW